MADIRINRILLVSPHEKGTIAPSFQNLLGFCTKITALFPENTITTHALVSGKEAEKAGESIAKTHPLDGVHVLPTENEPRCPYEKAGILAEMLSRIPSPESSSQKPFCSLLVFPHTTRSLETAGLFAGLSRSPCFTAVEGAETGDDRNLVFIRQAYGGKAVEHLCLKTDAPPEYIVLTLRPGSFRPVGFSGDNTAKAGPVLLSGTGEQKQRIRLIRVEESRETDTGPDRARVVVAAGRGVLEKENLGLVEELAACFPGSAIAGSRPVCDMGWLPYGRQVGQTGKTVSPALYIACGISGASQHVDGMRGSDFVVSVNTDPNAAMFRESDLCVVEDIRTFLPVLKEKIQEAASRENRKKDS